jgi:hypothetical protein
VDAPRAPEPPALAEQVARLARAADGDGPDAALALPADARLFVDSHDNAYLTVETIDSVLARDVFAHALAAIVAEAPERPETGAAPPVEPAPHSLVDELWAMVPAFDLRVVENAPAADQVRIAVAERAPGHDGIWGRTHSRPRTYIAYQPGNGHWLGPAAFC